MHRFTAMLAEGMAKRGHDVSVWSPKRKFFSLRAPSAFKKWLGYVDQYILFPSTVRKRLKSCPADTLFVFTDQAQGPWVPLMANRRHVMHCHDFLAQLSAMGKIAQHKSSWTGKLYQKFIRNGYRKGKNFISVSRKTDQLLQQMLPDKVTSTAVVYNGLDQSYRPFYHAKARRLITKETGIDLAAGYCLHVGGNQWYKNREGVIEIYTAWRAQSEFTLPLLMIGPPPSAIVLQQLEASPFKEDVHFISNLSDEFVQYAYAGANVFLFPSHAEGFGWPIAEAMASGCPVMTTNEAPMTEVAGDAAFLIAARCPDNDQTWASEAALTLQQIVSLTAAERKTVRAAAIKNVKRFDAKAAVDKIEFIYEHISS
ncbi:glycosyltransferase [Pedobacter sp. MR2016-24]|nr:glycosyltransferase [Pedobacter sp. MR2016-24]